jgi:DNA-binding response OmpR family regulator
MDKTHEEAVCVSSAGSTPRSILVATDDPDLAGLLASRLAALELQPLVSFTETQVVQRAADEAELAAVVVDSDFLAGGAAALVEHLRSTSPTPVVVMGAAALAAPGSVEGVLGALLAAAPAPTVRRRGPTLAWGPLELDGRTHEAWLEGVPLPLTPIEFRILTVLLEAGGGLVRKAELELGVWGTPSVDDGERLATHVRRIRQKVEADPAAPAILLTVRGLGYRLAGRHGRAAAAGVGRRAADEAEDARSG